MLNCPKNITLTTNDILVIVLTDTRTTETSVTLSIFFMVNLFNLESFGGGIPLGYSVKDASKLLHLSTGLSMYENGVNDLIFSMLFA